MSRSSGNRAKISSRLASPIPGQSVVPGLEALGPCAVRQNDLVAIEHDVDIGHILRFELFDALTTQEVLGCDEDFVVFEQQRGFSEVTSIRWFGDTIISRSGRP